MTTVNITNEVSNNNEIQENTINQGNNLIRITVQNSNDLSLVLSSILIKNQKGKKSDYIMYTFLKFTEEGITFINDDKNKTFQTQLFLKSDFFTNFNYNTTTPVCAYFYY